MKNKIDNYIIEQVITHAVKGFGLGKLDAKKIEYEILLDNFKEDNYLRKEVLDLFVKSFHTFLISEIETVTGIPEPQVIKTYLEAKKLLTKFEKDTNK
jgi:hypothetical protein